MKKSELIKRTYRITRDHDKKVKSQSRKSKKTESGFIRNLIEASK